MGRIIQSSRWFFTLLMNLLFFASTLGAMEDPKTKAPSKPEPWAPISKEVWDLRNDPLAQSFGAMVIEDRVQLGIDPMVISRSIRIRILSEPGRAAAEIQKWIGEPIELDARIVHSDGTEIKIDKNSDLIEKTFVGFQNVSIARKVLIPPGVSSDCVFEIRYSFHVNPLFEGLSDLSLVGPFPVRTLMVEVGPKFPFSTNVLAGIPLGSESGRNEGVTKWVYHNVLPSSNQPHLAQSQDPTPRLLFYTVDKGIKLEDAKTPQLFWNAVAKKQWKTVFNLEDSKLEEWYLYGTRYKKRPLSRRGPKFESFAKDITSGLTGSPQVIATELFHRMNAKLKRWSYVSPAEAAILKSKGLGIEDQPLRDLELFVEHGGTHAFGWMVVYYTLLKSMDIHPVIVKVPSIHSRPLIANLFSSKQFHWTLLRIDEEGKPPLWIDTDPRFAMPGDVSPEFQGVGGVAADSKTWSTSLDQVSYRAPEACVSQYTSELNPQDGAWSFKETAEFYRQGESRERMRFLKQTPEARIHQLTEDMEGLSSDVKVDSVRIGLPEDSLTPFSWQVIGRSPMTKSDRLLVNPFLMVPRPIWVPKDLENDRKTRIYLGPPETHRLITTIHIPEGYTPMPTDPFQRENAFGKVRLEHQVGADGKTVTLRMDLTRKKGAAEANEYHEFRSFLAWVSIAMNHKVAFERGGKL